MKETMIKLLIKALLSMLTEERLKEFADRLVDLIEDVVSKSDNKWDDAVILPLCALVRKTFDVEA